MEVTRRDESGEAEEVNSLKFYPLGFLFHSSRKTQRMRLSVLCLKTHQWPSGGQAGMGEI